MNTVNKSVNNRVIFMLSLIGIAMAIYVTQSFLRQTSIFCVNGGGCEAVRNAPQSWLFGIFPVPAVGLIGYTIIAICSFLRTLKIGNWKLEIVSRTMLGMSTFGVLFVTWFTYTELFIIKGVCTWCAISAINMYIIFALSIKSYLQEKRDTV